MLRVLTQPGPLRDFSGSRMRQPAWTNRLGVSIFRVICEHVEKEPFMPARSERVYLYPDLHPDRQPEPGRILEFPLWWDRREFFSRFKAREVDCSNPVDEKSAYLMFVDDAVTFDKECLERTTTELGTLPPHIRDRQAEFIDALRQSKWVIVESYEWG